MSAPPSTAKHDKATVPDATKNGDSQPLAPEKKPAPLEEDDEFEDFPVEDWTEEETQIPNGNAHLWEESWDDDDTNEDFAVQLRYVDRLRRGKEVIRGCRLTDILREELKKLGK
jgi:26 proteasome complex subunit DSS1